MKAIRWIVLTIVGLLAAAVCAVCIIWHKELKTISSVRMVGGNEYLYEMTYYAKYDLDEIIKSDIDENSKLLQYVISKVAKGLPVTTKKKAGPASLEGDHCTSFQVKKEDSAGYLYGRNYDYFKNPTLVVHTHPKDGYSSVSVTDMALFGYGIDKLPSSFAKKVLCIAAAYAPLDGVNEKGLCTSIMALPNQPAQQRTGKHAVGTSILMRLWLDRCATVQEAIDLLSTVDMRHDEGAKSGYHYMVADAKGDCAVIEFDKEEGWKTMIVRKPADRTWMVVTNHLLDPKYYTTEPDESVGNPHSRSWWRYDKVSEYINERYGVLSPEQAQECLAKVHWKDFRWDNGTTIEDTQYSNVYDQSERTLSLRPWNEYEKTYKFAL